MKISKKYILLILGLTSTSLILNGCSKKNISVESIQLSKGSIVKEVDGTYSNYKFESNEYSKIETEKVILSYDLDSGNYIYNSNGKNGVVAKDNEIPIDYNNPKDLKLSKGGNYFSYFKDESYMELVIRDVKNNKDIQINSNVAISGTLVEWLNEDTLVYYGIDDKKNNGIFTYNLKENKEELIYKLQNGFIQFLRTYEENVIFVQQTMENNRYLKIIDLNKNVKDITSEIIEVSDVLSTEKGLFVLGKMKDNNYSIYKIEGGNVKRLVFDFPNIIHLEKGLSCDKDGNLLFIGSTSSFSKEKVYTYVDGSITSLTNLESKYHFIEVK
ncbi:hypothetical protein [Clostridium chauvoei]|nr:hypothetical protein [Clostridium chauvoei]ATD55211.1 hypothetical protein BTM20_08140 [Clostridium chauvoei]MBX7279555.1 hypothetical protein [Clostridium chauvoei]MBX7281924.1 hypothetical protein [Clostridium chauvoei]MBX7284487.1 hypothetical protein [Clostridium chauvoei]MBX7286968.1 hypothetical protein [Clostridium chauvoei]